MSGWPGLPIRDGIEQEARFLAALKAGVCSGR